MTCNRTRRNFFAPLISNQRGQGLAEYIIITIIVAIVLILAVRFFGESVSGRFENATQEITLLGKDDREPNVNSSEVSDGNEKGTAPNSGPTTTRRDTGSEGKTAGGKESSGGGSGGSDSMSGLRPDSMAGLRPDSVGLKENQSIEELAVNWQTLSYLFALCCLIGVYILMRLKKKTSSQKKKEKKPKKKLFSLGKRKPEGGQAIVEFLFIAITFLFTLLGVMQLALCLNAYAMVRYAAYNAARAAIVHGADNEKMREAARLSLVATFPKHGRADHRRGFMENYLAAKGTDSMTALPASMGNNDSITEVRVVDNNGLSAGDTVTFDDPAEGQRGVVTVEVKHYYELVVPLVNRMLFYMYWRWNQGDYRPRTLDFTAADSHPMRQTGGTFYDIEYRIPIVAHYTMRLQSDYVVP